MNERQETTPFSPLDVHTLRTLLNTHYFGTDNSLVYVPTLESTNTYAMDLARQGSKEGTIVLTDFQTAGKGRQGRYWLDRSQHNAISSTILRPLFPSYLLVMLASLAILEAIQQTCDIEASIKWPNDILIRDRKVAGILIETSHDRSGRLVAIIGIGVNINGDLTPTGQPGSPTTEAEFAAVAARATTLETEVGSMVRRELFLSHLLQSLENFYLMLQQEAQIPSTPADGPASRLIREQWRQHLSTLGRTVEVRQGNRLLSGVAEGVDEHGELLLRRHSGESVSVTWGDIGYPTE